MQRTLPYLVWLSLICGTAACSPPDGPTTPTAITGGPLFARSADTEAERIVRRLLRVANGLSRAGGRLDEIAADFSPPPDPIKPAVTAALAEIRSQANHLLDVAAAMEARMR